MKQISPIHFTLSSVAVLVLTAGHAFAENNIDEPVQLDTVMVNEAADSTATEKTKSYTTSAMKTTTGLELSPKETPQSVSVITKTQLDDQNITRMEEALRTTTGINVLKDSGRYRYQSRGFYIDQIEEDGISSIVPGSATNPYVDAQSMTDLAVYDHIEVVRGATGLTQANGAPGGTINAVRKRPTAATQIQGDISVNRFQKLRTTADVSGSLNASKSLRGRLLTALERDPTFQDTKNNTGLLYGVIEADLAEYTKLTVGALHQRQRQTPDPSGLLLGTQGEDLGLPYDAKLFATWNKAVFAKTNVFAELDHFFSENWKLNTKLLYTYNTSDQKFSTLARRNDGDPSEIARIGISSHYDNSGSEIAFKTNLSGKYPLFGREHDLFFTYSYIREKGYSHNIDVKHNDALSYNIFRFNGNQIPYPDWNNKGWDGMSSVRFETNSLYAGTRFNPLDSLHLLIAGNYSYFKSHYIENAWNYNRNRASTENTLTKQHHLTPYYGITYDLGENNSLYASYTSIFKPSYGRKDKSGKQVNPKTGNNYELGWKSAWYQGKLNTSLALFQLDEKNRPINITTAMDPTADKSYILTAGKVRSRGWEAEISGNITDNWKLFAGYTYNYTKYLVKESASILANMNFSTHTPKHMFRLYTSYRLPFDDGKWTVGAGLSAQSETMSSRKIKQGGYTVWNANIQYDVNKNIKLHLIGSNLTNKRYYQNQANRNNIAGNFYGEPLNITFKLDWQF